MAVREFMDTDEALADGGFDRPPPLRLVDAGRERRILLHHCPFRETAEEHREVVGPIHLGLMQGVLTKVDAPVGVDRLDPLVEPDWASRTWPVAPLRMGPG